MRLLSQQASMEQRRPLAMPFSASASSLAGDSSAIKSTVQGLTGTLESINSGVGQASTFILVVGALAAITLVLELAILIRKLSN